MSIELNQYFSPASETMTVEAFDPAENDQLSLAHAKVLSVVCEFQTAERQYQGLETLKANLESFRDSGVTPEDIHWANQACKALGLEGLPLPVGVGMEDFATPRRGQLLELSLEGLSDYLKKMGEVILTIIDKLMGYLDDFIANLSHSSASIQKETANLKAVADKLTGNPKHDTVTLGPNTATMLEINGKPSEHPQLAVAMAQTLLQDFAANKAFNLKVKTFITSLVGEAEEVIKAGEGFRSLLPKINQLEPPVAPVFTGKGSQSTHTVTRTSSKLPGGYLLAMETPTSENSHGNRGAQKLTEAFTKGVTIRVVKAPNASDSGIDKLPTLSARTMRSSLESVTEVTKALATYEDTARDLLKLSSDFKKRIRANQEKLDQATNLPPAAKELATKLLLSCAKFSSTYIRGETAAMFFVTRVARACLRYVKASLAEYQITISGMSGGDKPGFGGAKDGTTSTEGLKPEE